MIQIASVFGEQGQIALATGVPAGLDRVRQQGKKLGRPAVTAKIEDAIKSLGSAGRRRERKCTASEAGDGQETGDSFSVPDLLRRFLGRSGRPVLPSLAAVA